MEHLAANIRTLRLQHKRTQAYIAKQLGVTVGEISHYERGRATPPTNKLAHMARLYGTTVDNLIK